MAHGSAPFIIHGPFGTGKSTTLVEAIQQLYTRYNDVRILSCAPSNSAADNIATRLKNPGKTNVFMLNAATPEYETLQPPDLKQFNKDLGLLCPDPDSDGMRFRYPDYQTLLKYKTVVATCVTAGVPSGLGIKPGHFDWIFVDEAGQLAKPEGLLNYIRLNKWYTGLALDPQWDENEEIDFTVLDVYVRKHQQEHASNMGSLERRIGEAILRRQGLEAEDRYSDEED
ncbi:hypothetical protein FRC00_012710 [Tulasnella sp. 408]|nr:hypothetical protein FRC00_012710 [Tulasnella sp. 408]